MWLIDGREGVPPAIDRVAEILGRNRAGLDRVLLEHRHVGGTVIVLQLRGHEVRIDAGERGLRFLDAILQQQVVHRRQDVGVRQVTAVCQCLEQAVVLVVEARH